MQSKYDSYSGSDDSSSTTSSSGGYDDIELKLAPYTNIETRFDRVFGWNSEYGQSLGVNMIDTELVDGAYYYYPDKDRYKIVSWKEEAGLDPYEALDRGKEITADDADEIRVESYGNGTQQYELVAARAPRIEDEDGDTLVEATSKRRDFTMDGDTPDFSEWEELDGETIPLPDSITWYGGTTENGPSTTAKSMLETLTEYGSDAVVDEDDIYNWLPDDSGDDLLRSDIKGRRVDFFIVQREGESGYNYNVPIIEDSKTGERVQTYNSEPDPGSSTSTDDDSDDAVEAAKEADSGSYPEPVADFVSSGRRLNMNRERAEKLLDELVSDPENLLTQQMLEDNGGRDAIIEEVI